jgi:hypothetical protein
MFPGRTRLPFKFYLNLNAEVLKKSNVEEAQKLVVSLERTSASWKALET